MTPPATATTELVRPTAPAQRGELTRRLLRAGENWFLQHPQVGRRGLGLLRTVKPVLRVGGVTVVTRYGHVREVLGRDDDFTVGHYAPKMEALAGRFILGLQHTPEYEHDVSVLRLAAPRTDVPLVRALLQDVLDRLLAQVRPVGRLDVVRDLADAVPAQLSARYFGVPGPDQATLVRWGRAMFRELFYDLRDDPAISGPAGVAARELAAHVDRMISTRRAQGSAGGPDDVLGRLLELLRDGELGIDDDWVRTYLVGLVIGMLPLTSKAMTLAVDALLRRPALLARAQQAVARDDDALLWGCLSEAMRFAPQSPGQFRVAETEQVLGTGTGRRHVVPGGTRVFAATQSAMLDRRAFPAPGRVRTDRPASTSLHFGHGLHSCFGRYLSYEAQLPLMAKALLGLPGLRRAAGPAGRLRWDGPFPDSLPVEFDAS